jgi:phenylalanyl-tRNA synthetase beta chain
MKVSLNWIFDHIDSDVHKVNVAQLVSLFIKTTAEIEEWRAVSFDADQFTLVKVLSMTEQIIEVYSPELNKNLSLTRWTDVAVGSWYLVYSQDNKFFLATMRSVGGTKDTLLPAVFVKESLRSGGWKKTIDRSDYIIDIDNKSINHRPDLWGHRGIAREIAAILDIQLRPLDMFLAKHDIIHHASFIETEKFSVSIKSIDACKRFSALSIDSVSSQASELSMLVRLSRLDSKPIDFIVDCTNYVMLDLGQPMHAFDAQALKKKEIIIRRAHEKEKLTLLDGETVTLTPRDIVIADGDTAVSLAGVMGGATTGITAHTHSLLLEAATFDAATIRRTAVRYKKRTEASMRFEKSLSPSNSMNAIARYLYLLNFYGIEYKSHEKIICLGSDNPVIIIDVAYAHIERLLGIAIAPEKVQKILEKLSFTVETTCKNNSLFFHVTVPSFRATKDISIAEDIIEEIGRYIGYDSIPQDLPLSCLTPSDLYVIYTTRSIKRCLSTALSMKELYCYSFFDESFLQELLWQPQNCVELKNPISENYTRLVSTLQPHLLKAVRDNSIHHTQLSFYEYGRTWHMNNGNIIEKKSVSGIFFEQNTALDFYEGKNFLLHLFKELQCDVLWDRNDMYQFSWLSPHQSAKIMHNDVCIGIAGMVQDNVINILSAAGGAAFIFELDADYLSNYKHPVVRFKPLSKYPAVYRDISIIINISITAKAVIDIINGVATLIRSVTLIDFFTKEEWKDEKSLTLHIEIRDDNKTLEHDEVEHVWQRVIAALQQYGAKIR